MNIFNNNLPNQVSAIVDLLSRKPKIIQLTQCLNEADLIKPCLLQAYDEVDRIICIEGATQNKVAVGDATPDGHSIDNTVEVIKDVITNHDPKEKIVFCQLDRPFKDLEEMKNTFLNYVQDGDFILILDADEFVMPGTVTRLREAISLEPWMCEVVPLFMHFWRDKQHMRSVEKQPHWGSQHQRFVKYEQGMHYRTHPVLTLADGSCSYFTPQRWPRRFTARWFEIFHYSYMETRKEKILGKKGFYEKELGNAKHGNVASYERGGQVDEFANKTEKIENIVFFAHAHPPILDGHPMMSYAEPFFEGKSFKDYELTEPYCYQPQDIPLIYNWMVVDKRCPIFTNPIN